MTTNEDAGMGNDKVEGIAVGVVPTGSTESNEGSGGDRETKEVATSFVAQFKQSVADELFEFRGQEVLTLAWGPGARTTVRVSDVIRVGKGVGRVILEWKPEKAASRQIAIEPSFYQPTDGPLKIQFVISVFRENAGSKSYNTFSIIDFAEGKARVSGGKRLVLPLPKPAPDYGTYTKFWFRHQNAEKLVDPRKLSGSLKDFAPNMEESLGLPIEFEGDVDLDLEGARSLAKALGGPIIMRCIELVMQFSFQGQRIVFVDGSRPDSAEDLARALGLPTKEDYLPKRSVDLSPADLQKYMLNPPPGRGKMFFPWHVYQAVCTSLNLGRNLILTGPPGCGKTELAIAVARLAAKSAFGSGKEPKVVTASPAWTSGDVIGRYFPKGDGAGLRFQPGVYLQAVESQQWLIIDELNRANLDHCFGELFTVLSGQPVDLPFEVEVESEGEDDGNRAAPGMDERARNAPTARRTGRVVPTRRPTDTTGKYREWVVSDSFRLLGTMNDADRSSLHQLSFALLRRFDVIQIDAPSPDDIKSLVDERVKEDIVPVASKISFRRKTNDLNIGPKLVAKAIEVFSSLFANGTGGGRKLADDSKNGLIADRVVGVATLLDLIKFLAEGLRLKKEDEKVLVLANADHVGVGDDLYKNLVASFIGIGLVLAVFPQLDSLDDGVFGRACNLMIEEMKERNFIRIQPNDDAEGDDSAPPFRLKVAMHDRSGIENCDGEEPVSVAEFLRSELLKKYRGTTREPFVKGLLSQTKGQ